MDTSRIQKARKRVAYPDHAFPLASDAVRSAYHDYWSTTREDPATIRQQQVSMAQTNTLISDFCDKFLTPQTYHAATLGGIVDALDTPSHTNEATHALRIYRQESKETPEEQLNVLGLLQDRQVINNFWERRVLEQYGQEERRLDLLTDINNRLEVRPEEWRARALGTRATDILRVRSQEGVNIESLLIGSAETLQWLHSDKAEATTDTYRHIHQAQQFYAPLSEFIGFDGLAMGLQSQSEILKAKHSGQEHLVQRAQTIIEELGSPEVVEQRVETMLRAVLGETNQRQVLTHTNKHGVIIGEGKCLDRDLRVVWRRKTLGGILRKLSCLEKDKIPMDIIGATVIVQDPEQIGRELRAIMTKAELDPRIVLTPSPSRTKPFHVKGSSEYRAAVARGMGYTDVDEMARDVDVKDGDYQVGKVTFRFQRWGEPLPLHTEIQFCTATDRIDARIGSAAHAAYRLAEGQPYTLTQEDTVALADFRAQKKHLGQDDLTPLSRPRAHELLRRIS